MSQYDEIDSRIFNAIENKKSPIYSSLCVEEAKRISKATGRDVFRVIDGRLQAMRKAGKIIHRTKAEANGIGGWHVVTQKNK